MKKTLAMLLIIPIRMELYSAESEIVLKSTNLYFLLFITAAALIIAVKCYFTGKKNKLLYKKLQEDIQKKQSEKHLAIQEANRKRKELNQIIEYAPIGIAIRSISGELISVNNAYANILGYTREELLAGKFDTVGYMEDVAKSEEEYQKLLEGKESVHIDKRLIKSDGSIIYVSQNLVLIRDQEDVPLFLVGMSVDITDRRKALMKLQESEEFYKSVLSNMSGIVYNCLYDENWTMTYITENIEIMTGYSASDMINNEVRSFSSIIHPDDRIPLQEVVDKSLEIKKPYNHEYRLVKKNGDICWVYEIGRGIFDVKGNLSYLSGTIIDITHRKAAELELEKYRHHLEDIVAQRTKEIEEKNIKLQEFNKLFIGREFRIKELRDQVKELKNKIYLQEH